MQRKTKLTLVLIAIVVLFMQTLFGSLPTMAIENLSSQPYYAGKTAKSPIVEQLVTASPDSATIQMIQTTADSTVIYVDAAKENGGDGIDWATAYNDLQSALDEASSKLNAGATAVEIWLAQGTYKPTKKVGGTDNRYKTFQMQNNVAIYGGFSGTETERTARDWEQYPTILSGDIDNTPTDNEGNSYHVFYHPDGLQLNATAILDGVTIKGGNAINRRGGGMHNYNSSPTLTNVTFEGNTASDGGGMHNYNSSPALTHVTFSSNTAPYSRGGGMYNIGGSPTLTHVIFESNTASYGGGMYNNNSSPTLTRVTFSSNTAPYSEGGGMYNIGGSPRLTNVIFDSNTAKTAGGGMSNSSSSPTLTHVTFSSNTATYYGGGMSNSSSSPTLTHVTFSSNTATYYGGGMYNSSSSPTLTNVTFERNTASSGGGMSNSSSSSPTLTNVTFERNTASDGGGMYNYNSSPTLTNVTFSSNEAHSGGGMFNNSSSPTLKNVTMSGNETTLNKGAIYGGSPKIDNSIIAGNNGEPALHSSVNAMIENSLLDVEESGNILAKFHQSTTDIQSVAYTPEAIFIDSSQHNYQLRAGSPAINKGNNALNTQSTDLLNNPRIQGSFIDLGAYESEFAYHVFYDANGATGNRPVDQMTYKQGDTVTVQNNSGILERTGYTFEGWNTEADGQGLDYAENTTFIMGTQNQLLYAKWTVETYLVTFESNGGSAVIAQQIPYNTQISEPTPPSKQGHAFVGWYKDAAFTDEWGFATNVVTEAITLYAKWTMNPTYTVIYDRNGATGGTVPQDYQAYEENASATVQGNSGQLVRTNYTFKGWNTQADGKGISYAENAIFQMGQGNVTLYAEWTANPPTTGGGSNPAPTLNNNYYSPPTKVRITLHANGGTAIAPIDISSHTKVGDLPVPIREGYRFEGWYQDEALTKRWEEETILRENISLYAKWTAIPIEEPEPSQPAQPIIPFHDVEKHWAKEMIEELTALGIIQGFEDGTFRPNAPISRMHVAVLLTRAFSLDAVREADGFSDVPSTHPHYEAIQTLQQAGIIDGASGAFLPAENMTRAQLAKVLVGVLELTPEGTSSFVDVAGSHWSAGYIATLEREGITLGDNGQFRPNEPVTRAQFVAFLYRIMQK
ncbi:InlB B-repeat-containing protein [Metasolibacillus sp. FSL H7-0170]|uniref:InlB B-repeat-containing protein n=1 Tax=Metasolibacillus sp. FSL H7-0170 TaxID=2921431 RepID=UPI0031594D74